MAEESWHEARLIPTSGINGAEEQERRATSALLAVLSAVREFGRALRQAVRCARPAPSSATSRCRSCWASRRLYPDGLIRVARGAKSWTALVEVKTGTERARHRAARELPRHRPRAGLRRRHHHLATRSRPSPASTRPRSTSASCARSRCTTCRGRRCSPRRSCRRSSAASPTPTRPGSSASSSATSSTAESGALEFDDMGEAWVGVRDAVAAGTLRADRQGHRRGRRPVRRAAALRQPAAGPPARHRGRPGAVPQGAGRPDAARARR